MKAKSQSPRIAHESLESVPVHFCSRKKTGVKLRTTYCVPYKRKVLVCSGRVSTNRLVWNVLQFFGWEVRCVCDGPQVGDERSTDMSDGFPINASKKRMGLDDFYRQSMILRDDEAKCFSRFRKQNEIRTQRPPHRRTRSSASRLKWTSSGNARWFFQSMIFLYVSCVFSEQKGG